jgi:dCTP deaminase
MILRSKDIAQLLRDSGESKDPLIIAPTPDTAKLETDCDASVDLRLGSWFVMLKQARLSCMDIDDAKSGGAQRYTKTHYVRFGDEFILHPRSFVLGTTLEWIRLPRNLAAIVTGKSSWGRRGLIIATATGVHPGFSGCLTLEITNLGEIPIMISPGMHICQLFVHEMMDSTDHAAKSSFAVSRKPRFGLIKKDTFADLLSKPQEITGSP